MVDFSFPNSFSSLESFHTARQGPVREGVRKQDDPGNVQFYNKYATDDTC